MDKLQKIQEALEANYGYLRPLVEGTTTREQYELLAKTQEGLDVLRKFRKRLDSEELIDKLESKFRKMHYDRYYWWLMEDGDYRDIAQAAINAIKGERS